MGVIDDFGTYPEPTYSGAEPPNGPPVATATAAPEPEPQPSFTSGGPPRWTSADDVRYARKAASLNQVGDDLDAGVLHPQYAQPLLQKLTVDLSAMDQRKQAFTQLQQQEATQTALGQNAMQRAVEQSNQQHAADGFLGTMRTFIDPISGRDAHFYQAEPGKWEQVQLGDTAPVAGGGEEGGEVAGQPDEAEQPFVQTIDNGPHVTQTTWQPGQQTGVSTGAWQGMPGGKPPPGPEGSFGLTPEKLQEIHNLASLHSSHLPPGPQKNALYSHIAQRLTGAAISERAAGKRQAAIAASKQQAESDKEWKDLRTSAHASIETDHKAAVKAGEPSPFGSAAERLKAADDLAHEQWAARHPEDKRAKDWLAKQDDAEKPSAAAESAKPIMRQIIAQPKMTAKQAVEMVDDEMKLVKADDSLADRVPHPEEPGMVVGGPWSQLPPSVQRAEAERRVAAKLGIRPKPTASPAAPFAGPPSQQPPIPLNQPTAAAVKPLPPNVYTDAEIKAEIARKQQEEREKARPWWHKALVESIN